MTLHFIGIGLNDEKDITVKGLEIVKKCDFIYLECYTSKLQCDVAKLEEFYGKEVILADRELVEKKADEILEKAKDKEVAFLVIGDIFGATTHTDLLLRAKKANIKGNFVYNASIMNAIGITGLELYKFGITTSVPYPSGSFEPETAYDVIKKNKQNGLHTLVLLDIKSKEGRFMTVNEALNILLNIEKKRKEKVVNADTMCLGCARIGGDHKIKYAKASKLLETNFGGPLHCLVFPGNLHFIEEEALEQWK
ncbi:MAG: diphthine synthase [archaeon]